MNNPNDNPNCDNDKCVDRNSETRFLPYGPAGYGYVILCLHCYNQECSFHEAALNESVSNLILQTSQKIGLIPNLILKWDDLKVHTADGKEEIKKKIERLETEQMGIEHEIEDMCSNVAVLDQEISDLKDKLLSL